MSDRPTVMTRAHDGALLVLGSTTGDMARTNPHQAAWDADIFVSKISEEGELLWTTQWGAVNHDVALGLAVNAVGEIFVTGGTMGGIEPGKRANGVDVYCSKLSAGGELQWTKQWSASGDEYGRDIALHGDALFIVGSSNGGLQGEGAGGMFLRKLDMSGEVLWTQVFGATFQDSANAVAVEADGTIVVGGQTEGELVSGAVVGFRDAFVSKWDAEGNLLWVEQVGTEEYEDVRTMTLGPDGTIFLGGGTTGAFPGFFNPGSFDYFVLTFAP